MEKTVQRMAGLTANEIEVLNASRVTDYGDCMDGGEWSFAVADKAGMNPRVFRGVAASLVKKGYVAIWDNGEKGRTEDMVFSLTEAGRALFEEAADVGGA